VKITYFVNQYPKVSHTFIRREIFALEAAGVEVVRVTARPGPEAVVDPDDIAEQSKARVIAQGNMVGLLRAGIGAFARAPVRFLQGVKVALRLGFADRCRFAHNLVYLLEACILQSICEEEGSTHVHAHFGTNSTSVAMLCKLLGGPDYSFTVHGPQEFDEPGQISITPKIENARFVVAITSFCRSQLMRWCNYQHWSKFVIVHCAVDDKLLTLEHKPITRANHFINIGRLCEQKAQLLLVDAIRLVRDRGIDVSLDLIGDGELREPIEAFIDQHKLHNNIRLLGWCTTEQIIESLDDSTGLLMPSFAEGLPVSIMESFARKRPVLSTYIAGIPELIDESVGGLIPAGDVQALADKIAELCQMPLDALNAMGAEGYRRVSAQHNADTEAGKLKAAIFGEDA
jgi:glycosyltransferase involved in cell wall biosynthesis